MAIVINGNYVCLGGGCFCATPTGIDFSGFAGAEGFAPLQPQGPIQGSTLAARQSCKGPTTPENNTFDSMPFSTETASVEPGDLNADRGYAVPGMSSTHGYVNGSSANEGPEARLGTTMEKFPFASFGSASDIGELVEGLYWAGGASSCENGYIMGGEDDSGSPLYLDTIQKYPFASDSPSSDIGEMPSAGRGTRTGSSSSGTDGYTMGSLCFAAAPYRTNELGKFPFSSDSPSTCIGNLSVFNPGGAQRVSHNGSDTIGGNGYGAGADAPNASNVIAKFPFAADGNMTDVGDMACTSADERFSNSGTAGYIFKNCHIQCMPFASDSNATCITNFTNCQANNPSSFSN